jgi:hypothetical protein
VLAVGADADITLVDLDAEAVLTADALHSKGKCSAYEGMAVKGLPVATFVRGHLVAKDGEPVADPGHGRMVSPTMPAPRPRNSATTLKAVLEPHQKPYGDPF